MYQQTGLLFYKFRFLLAGLFTIAFLLLISALITAVGSNTVFSEKTTSSADVLDINLDSTNIVANGASRLAANTKHATLSAGTALYKGCRSVTMTTAQSGRVIARGSADTAGGVQSGTVFVTRELGDSFSLTFRATSAAVLFTLRLPGHVVGSIASIVHKDTLSAIKPTDDKPTPVISSETSAAALANINAQQQQEIAQLQAAQLTANHGLAGAIVAGDPNHGGYPAKWDNIPQDSALDSWGMYNRECVSYAAWKVYQTYGNMPYWGGVGNANQWVSDAQRAGIPTGSTPQVHSVAIAMRGYYGHAMWVEAVSGNMIYVSQYNYNLDGRYSEMWVSGSSLTYLYFK